MNLLTEEEARTKWCPYARVVTQISGGCAPGTVATAAVNRAEGDFDKAGNCRPEPIGAARCIASECMAWRAVETLGPVVERRPVEANKELPDGFTGFEPAVNLRGYWVRQDKIIKGYCGAFGAAS